MMYPKSLEHLFINPPDEYYPVPWWAWTGELGYDLMDKQLQMMHDQGIREFIIFPIYGMVPEYMSDEYLDRIEWTVNKCEELGMKVWIYDELSWPSGTAAGLVYRHHPDAIASNLELERYDDVTREQIRKLLPNPSVIHIARINPDGIAGEPVVSEDGWHEGASVAVYRRVKDTTANLTVKGCLWTKNDPGMLDMLSMSAGKAFIGEAYEPIAKRMPDKLGNTIKGFFTDEPSIAPGWIPWTDELPAKFSSKFGYSLISVLHDLNFDSPTSERTRMHYWSLVSEMSSEAFTGQIAKWCGERGMELTGHMVHEENSYSVWYHGDSFMHLRHMQAPGCDMLQVHTSYGKMKGWYEFGPASLIKTPKTPSSTARYTGRKRVMSEAYGVVPWTKTMADEKHVTDWLVALGVNMINDNSLISDISGFKKRAISGKHFTQPWWPDAHMYYDYAARICALASETTLDTELAILYPTTTWWAMTERMQIPVSDALRSLEVTLDQTMDVLLRSHKDCEFLFEPILETATVEDGVLRTENASFKAIVAAGITRLRPEAAKKLEEFAASGGTVILVGSEIEVMEKKGNRPISLPGAVSLEEQDFSDRLNTMLDCKAPGIWQVDGDESRDVVTASRIDENGRKLLFIANMTPTDKQLRIRWNGDWKAELWDADTGKRWMPEQSSGQLDLMLPVEQSIWVVQSTDDVKDTVPSAAFITTQDIKPVVQIDSPWKFSIDRPNLFKLQMDLLPDVDGALEPGSPEMSSNEGWITLDEDDSGTHLGADEIKYYWLRSEFTVEDTIPDLQLIADSDDCEAVYLNGLPLQKIGSVSVWDDVNLAFSVGKNASAGRNTLLLKVKASPYNSADISVFPTSTVEPVVLRGAFSVGQDDVLQKLPNELQTGDMRLQGFRHFVGSGIYEKSFRWDGPEGPIIIKCDTGRDLAEVIIDGVPLGKRAWGPRTFYLEKLTYGEHNIRVRTVNTLGCILRRFYGGTPHLDIPASGLLNPVQVYAV